VSHEVLGFVLLAVFFVAIFAGFPIAFTLMFLSLAFGTWRSATWSSTWSYSRPSDS